MHHEDLERAWVEWDFDYRVFREHRGAKLRKEMAGSGVSYAGIAKTVGVTERRIREWERGFTFPAGKRLKSLSVLLGLPAWKLAGNPFPGKALRWRRRMGYSQVRVAHMIGSDRLSYGNYERGYRVLSPLWAYRLAVTMESGSERKPNTRRRDHVA
jgi:transcriptional regulator with XRE-family HTH domain